MAKNRTAEEIADDNERTNAVGLFNYADSYLCCAKHLNASPSLHLRFVPHALSSTYGPSEARRSRDSARMGRIESFSRIGLNEIAACSRWRDGLRGEVRGQPQSSSAPPPRRLISVFV